MCLHIAYRFGAFLSIFVAKSDHMKQLLLLLFSICIFNTTFSQERVGKEADDQSETKRYKFTFEKNKMAEGISVSLPKG
ncbi:MAG TPA: hypothetical protein DCR46_01000, partial [Cytophagales bacterium]|nr:hypothetical protein [Cytophagales bacterium]